MCGQALGQILQSELYRVEFNGFEDYFRAKWEFSPRKAYDLIAAASLFTQLCTMCAGMRKHLRCSH